MTILLLIFLTATLVQLVFWTGFFSRLAFYRPPERPPLDDEPPVSVIICARNEAESLRKNIPLFLNQTYRSYEILVVDDNSTDLTAEFLLEIQGKSPKLRVVTLRHPTMPGKKEALSVGIQSARHDILLLTDADCTPAGPDWLRTMRAALRDNVEIGLGYSPYRRAPGILNRFIRFETIYTATQYLSLALAGMPYMGVGRNLIYTRRLYRESGGFHSHMHLLSGDDDLFVNAAARRHNTGIVLDKRAFVYSEPKHTWRGYYYQKRRHVSTGRRYRLVHRVLLGALAASHAGHYVTALVLLLAGEFATLVFLTCLARMAVVMPLYYRILGRLDEPDLRKWVPLLDAGFVLYYVVFAPGLLTGNVKRWK